MGITLWNPMNAMPANREFEVYHVVDGSDFKMASFHVHDHYEFYIYMSGNVDIAVEEKLYTPEPYSLFIYPPGVMHRAVARPDLERYERVYVYASRDCIKSMSTPEFPMMQIIENAPILLPIYSHRYMPVIDGEDDPPIISSIGRDTVCFADNLSDYIKREFCNECNHQYNDIQDIPFWSDIIRGAFFISKIYFLIGRSHI